MKCPLMLDPTKTLDGQVSMAPLDCIKEECAWWNSHTEECVAMSIGRILNHMSDSIYGIRANMPKDFEPRK